MLRTYRRPLHGLRIQALPSEGQPGSITGLREHPALDPSSDQPLQAMPQKRALTSLFGASCENVESPH